MKTANAQPSRGIRWLKRYIDPSSPNGLPRTLAYGGIVASICLFSLLLEAVHHSPHGVLLDNSGRTFAQAHRNADLTVVFRHLTELASVNAILLLFLISAMLLYRHHRKLIAVLLIAVALDGIVTETVKLLVRRVRPGAGHALVHETSYSFPSGHTMAAVLCWGIIAYFVARSCRRGSSRILVALLFAVFVLLIAFSRVYLGAHYASDVLGSMLLGGAVLGTMLTWIAGHPTQLPAELFGRTVIRAFAVAAIAVIAMTMLFPRLFL